MTSDATSDAARDARFDRRALFALLAGAFLVRIAAIVALRQGLALDVDQYRELAESLVRDGVYGRGGVATAYRPPLYPLLLAAIDLLGGLSAPAIAALHVALGVATVWLVTVLGQQWRIGRWRFLAAALVACDPILLRQSSVVMTETLATFLVALALVALSALVARPTMMRALAAGAALGAGVLCRPVFLLWLASAPVCLLWLLPTWPVRLRAIGGVALAAAVVLFPWAVRNQLQFGSPIVTTTHGGITILLGNNPAFYEHLRIAPDQPWDAATFNRQVEAVRAAHRDQPPEAPADRPAAKLPDEIANDRRERAQAWQHIRAEPEMFVHAVRFRLSRLWGVLPLALPGEGSAARALRHATAVWYAAVFGLALVGVWNLGRRVLLAPWVFGLLLAATLTAAHAVYWTDLRMRAPVAPVVSLLAAAGMAWLGLKISRRKPLDGK